MREYSYMILKLSDTAPADSLTDFDSEAGDKRQNLRLDKRDCREVNLVMF